MGRLFRDEVLQAQHAQWTGSINLATPITFLTWTLVAAALAAAMILFLFFGHYTPREAVSGQLIPSAGLLTLPAQTTGTVSRALVHEGEKVDAGQPLIEISANLVSASMGNTHAVVSAQLRDQQAELQTTLANLHLQSRDQSGDLHAQIEMLQAQVHQIDGQLSLQREQAASATDFVAKIKPSVAKGVISTAQFNSYLFQSLTEQTQVKALERQRLDTDQKLSSSRAQLRQLPLETAAKASKLHGELAQLQAQLAENETEGGSVLHAPRAGIVSTLLVKRGQNVTSGQPLLSIVPQGSKLEAQLWLPSSAIGFVEVGRRVVLRYQAYPYQKFGQQYGSVVRVSRSALSPSEAASMGALKVTVPMYRVLVALDRQTVDAYGMARALKPGMVLNADIMLDRQSLFRWVFQSLYGVRQSLATGAG